VNRTKTCSIAIVAVSFVVATWACGGGSSNSNGDDGGPDASTPDSTMPDASPEEASVDSTGPDAVEGATGDASDAASDAPAETAADAQGDAAADATADTTSADSPPDAPPDTAAEAASCDTDFWVDPTNGNDMTGTGCASTSADAGSAEADAASCAWRTITHATQTIGTPCAPTRLHVIGPATFGAAETYPLLIGKNVVLTTEGGAVELDVPPATMIGILLSGAGSGIRGGAGAPLTISGATSSDGGLVPGAQTGISLQFDAVSTLENLVVSYFSNYGIEGQNGSSLDIPQGLVATSNASGAYFFGTVTIHTDGASTSFSNNSVFGIRQIGGTLSVVGTSGAGKLQVNGNANGFDVEGGGSLTIAPTSAASFDGNRGTGFSIGGASSATMTGTPGAAPGTGTITVSNNPGNGIMIVPPATGVAPPSTLTGVVVYGNHVRGLYITGTGAPNVKIRRSIVLANGWNGVWIDRVTDVSTIDLGTTAASDGGVDYGYNVLQAAPDGGPNVGAGICQSTAAEAGVVNAAGNVFSGPRDCSLADAGVLTSNTDCSGTVDIGIFPGTGDVLTANCTH
jgi:hypothetical protein